MNPDELINSMAGEWRGENLLRLSRVTPPEYVSSSALSVVPEAKGKFLSFRYTWSHENVPHEGFLLVGYDAKQSIATAAWVDSWHQSNTIMYCKGTIDLRGSYETPPGPDSGWRIVITAPSVNEIQIVMYNCSPEGGEDLAVNAKYKRTD
jgi:hypothetical protein